MEVALALIAVIISVISLVASGLISLRALTLTRHTNTIPVLVDLFREHRSTRLAEAREYVFYELPRLDLSPGLSGLPEEKRTLVLELVWFYTNLGALVAHGIVDIAPVSGYLGTSAIAVWETIWPLVEAERKRRANPSDPEYWQAYFENLISLIRENPPEKARASERLWRLDKAEKETEKRAAGTEDRKSVV